MVRVNSLRKLSVGFDFPLLGEEASVSQRIALARQRLAAAGFETPVADDAAFETLIRAEILGIPRTSRCRIVADISSMNRSRIAALLVSCFEAEFSAGCDLDLVYFPSSFASHKHAYEPLEFFGPCHNELAGWPDDPDLPLSLLVGLGTEPRRADGVVELLEPDILALYVPLGDNSDYLSEIRRENRRVIEVAGQPDMYSLRDPHLTYQSLLVTATQLSARSRLVVVPLGPKVFCVLAMAAALSIGPQVGVWKASAGRGVQPVDVAAEGAPILFRLAFSRHQ